MLGHHPSCSLSQVRLRLLPRPLPSCIAPVPAPIYPFTASPAKYWRTSDFKPVLGHIFESNEADETYVTVLDLSTAVKIAIGIPEDNHGLPAKLLPALRFSFSLYPLF